MARATLILAKDIRQANQYAKLAGLERFKYRAVTKAGSIRGVRNAEVHILPGFLARPDRHQILAALKAAKTLDVYYVDPADLVEPLESHVASPLDESVYDEAYAINAEIDEWIQACTPQEGRLDILEDLSSFAAESEAAHPVTLAPGEVVAPALTEAFGDQVVEQLNEPTKRRRTRCKDCEELHFKDEECPVEVTKQTPTPPSAPAAVDADNFFA